MSDEELVELLRPDITAELMDAMNVHGSCKETDGEFTCSLDTGHAGFHIDLNDQFVVFEVPRVH